MIVSKFIECRYLVSFLDLCICSFILFSNLKQQYCTSSHALLNEIKTMKFDHFDLTYNKYLIKMCIYVYFRCAGNKVICFFFWRSHTLIFHLYFYYVRLTFSFNCHDQFHFHIFGWSRLISFIFYNVSDNEWNLFLRFVHHLSFIYYVFGHQVNTVFSEIHS